MTAYELVTYKLRDVTQWEPHGGKGDWRCPAHDDSSASLSVNPGRNGVVLNCHAGCTVDAILEALSLTKRDLFDEAPKQVSAQTKITDTYDYVDEASELLFQVVRIEPKTFRQRRPDGRGGWIWSLGDTRRVLYRLPRVLEAVANDQIVYVVEGEKDVAAVETAGAVATCNPGGASKWRPEYGEALRDADVVVVADRDGPGYAHARAVAAALKGVAARVWLQQPAIGKDVAEHLGAGRTLDQLAEITGSAADSVEVLHPFRRILLDLDKAPEPPALLVRWLYASCLTILQSEPGVGKSWVALWLTVQVIEEGWAVVYIDEEGGSELTRERLVALGANPAMVDERVFYYAFESRQWGEEDLIALDDVIRQAGRVGRGLGLAVLDSLPDFLAAAGLSEDSSMDVTGFVKKVCDRFRAVAAAALLLDHVIKPATEGRSRRSRYARGSGAKLAKADATLLLETKEEFDASRSGELKLWKTKDRRGRLSLPSLEREPAVLTVTVSEGTLRIDEVSGAAARRLFRPTGLMERVSMELENAPHHLVTKRSLRTLIPGDNNMVDAAIEALVVDRFAASSGRGITLLKPFRRDGEPVDNDPTNQDEWDF